jgi:hypothetical protein
LVWTKLQDASTKEREIKTEDRGERREEREI